MKPRRVGVGWRFWPARAEVRQAPVLRQGSEGARIIERIGPRRAREIAHDRRLADRRLDRRAILGGSGPQEQSFTAMEHETSPYLAPRRPRADA